MSDDGTSGGHEAFEPRSLLGLPVRILLAVGSVAFPLLAVAWFSATHAWPPPSPCLIAVYGCSSPLSVQSTDWFDLVGPVLGLASAVGAGTLRRDPAEVGTLIYRYFLPAAGSLVSVGSALQLAYWIMH